MNFRLHPEAEAEFLEAVSSYEETRSGLGAEFIEAVEDAIGRIVGHPRAWAILEGDVRRCLVGRFPYGVLYAEDDAGVLILAVMPLHREPGYWRARLAGTSGEDH